MCSCCRTRSVLRWYKHALPMRPAPRRRHRTEQARLPAAAAAVDAAERHVVKRATVVSGSSWRPAYVAVGSNLNQPRRQVGEAFERLAALPDTRLELRSRIYLTRPMGLKDQPDFVNAAAGLLTRLAARSLLDALLAIELAMGRRRQERWGPR